MSRIRNSHDAKEKYNAAFNYFGRFFHLPAMYTESDGLQLPAKTGNSG